MSIKRWVNKEIVVHTHDRIQLILRKEWHPCLLQKIWKKLETIMMIEISQSQKDIFFSVVTKTEYKEYNVNEKLICKLSLLFIAPSYTPKDQWFLQYLAYYMYIITIQCSSKGFEGSPPPLPNPLPSLISSYYYSSIVLQSV